MEHYIKVNGASPFFMSFFHDFKVFIFVQNEKLWARILNKKRPLLSM